MKHNYIVFLTLLTAPAAAYECATGYHIGNDTVGDWVPYNSQCVNGVMLQSDNIYIIPTPETKCSAGYHPSNGECVAFDTDGCPNDYYVPSDSVTRPTTGNTCASGTYGHDISVCDKITGASDVVCAPQATCNGAGTTIRTSSGIVLPLWMDKLTTPSLNVRFEDGTVCYMNMQSGAGNGTLNFKYDNNIYHGVE